MSDIVDKIYIFNQILPVLGLSLLWLLAFSLVWKNFDLPEAEQPVGMPQRFNQMISFCLTYFLTIFIMILLVNGLQLSDSGLGQTLVTAFAYLSGLTLTFFLCKFLKLDIPLKTSRKFSTITLMIFTTLVSFALLYLIVALGMNVNENILKEFNQPVTVHPEIEKMRSPDSSPLLFWLTAFSAVILAPIYEELMYRGFLHRFLTSALGLHIGIFVSSLLFALVHIQSTWLPIFIFALGLSYTRHWTRNLWPCILMHMTLNGSTMLTIYLDSLNGKA